jgi:hypothetical protein
MLLADESRARKDGMPMERLKISVKNVKKKNGKGLRGIPMLITHHKPSYISHSAVKICVYPAIPI